MDTHSGSNRHEAFGITQWYLVGIYIRYPMQFITNLTIFIFYLPFASSQALVVRLDPVVERHKKGQIIYASASLFFYILAVGNFLQHFKSYFMSTPTMKFHEQKHEETYFFLFHTKVVQLCSKKFKKFFA